MEISDFAERLLFGDRIEDKLTFVARATDLSDAHPRPALGDVKAPGRPRALSLNQRGRASVPFPSLQELEDPIKRGHVLHFFANHELLALELMSLALLRFPDAPAPFRHGLVTTILEEQSHLRLYVERMASAGVSLGEIPVNRYFWDMMASMRSPMDLVVRMSMTFEQANLDYAAFYANAFRTVGDLETAEVLRQVFEDEIKHVRHGVAWFEKWRAPHEDAFDTYCRLLPPPLTASRARGRVFHIEARRSAGLSEAFIRRLEVFGASRGRPPVLHWFNPTCEAEVAFGRAHTPSTDIKALVADLETIPALLTSADDVVLCQRPPGQRFLAHMHHAGIELPEFFTVTPGAALDPPHAHIGALRPWGWTPETSREALPLVDRLIEHVPIGCQAPWDEGRRAVYTKGWAARTLRDFSDQEGWPDWWTGPDAVGVPAGTVDEALDLCGALCERGYPRAVVKAPFGTSGRGAIRVVDAALAPGQRGWLQRVFQQQGGALIEPWLHRHVDLSVQLNISRQGRTRVMGLTRFSTDERGQYLGTFLCNATWGLPSDTQRWLSDEGRHKRRLPEALSRLTAFVGQRLAEAKHEGPAGIDMMICHSPHAPNRLALKPIVEINPRTTMGHVGLALHRRCAKGSVGFWRLLSLRGLARRGFENAADFADAALSRHPLEVQQSEQGTRWKRGVLFTNDPERATQVLSMAVIGTSPGDVGAIFEDLGLVAPALFAGH